MARTVDGERPPLPRARGPSHAPLATAPVPGTAARLAAFGRLVFHATVHDVRKSHRYAIAGLALIVVQTVVMVGMFWLMFWVMGTRPPPISDSFILYLLSGIAPYMVHAGATRAVSSAEGAGSPLVMHAPLTGTVMMAAAALASLYRQVLGLVIVFGVWHLAVEPIVIEDPLGVMLLILLAWAFGVGVGLLFASLRPWSPELATILGSVWSRANMIASGKMFVANAMPLGLLPWFDWNPLFHIIDQLRGAMFVDYDPLVSNWRYAAAVTASLLVLGLMAEAATRRRASVSWSAAR